MADDRKAKALVLMGELIGHETRVVKSPDRTLLGLRGPVVDETLNTLVIGRAGREIKVAKQGNMFEFGGTLVRGEEILFRPEDRIKKNWKRYDALMRKNR